jgi:hypothetical protein
MCTQKEGAVKDMHIHRRLEVKHCGVRQWWIGLWVILIVSTVLTLWSSPAWAIPAFARKYDIPCSVCHVPGFPKLNDVGNQFRDHGYQLEEEDDLPVFPGLGKGYWPVSFRTTVGYQAASLHNAQGEAGLSRNLNSGSFGFTGLDVLSFGILARDVSFGMVYTPGLGSSGFNSGSSAGEGDLEAAFIRLDNLFHKDYLVNVRVGKYELETPASEKRSPTLNTPFVMYHYMSGTPYVTSLDNPCVNSTCVGPTAGYSNANNFELGENQSGLELAGIHETSHGNFFRYSLNALSNSNLNQDNTGGGRALNFYGRVTQSFGGYGVVTGQRIGLFGVYGNAPTMANSGCPSAGCGATGGGNQPFYRAGADLSLTFRGQLNLIGSYMRAYDSKKLFGTTPVFQDAVWNGGFVELDYNPVQIPDWLFVYRYDLIRNNKQGDSTFGDSYNNVDSHTLMARYYYIVSTRVDLTLHAEYNYFQTKGTSPTGGDQRGQTALVGFDFAL